MSLKSSIQSQPPLPSLPSFASTFNTKSLNNLHADDNSLPPIQSRSSAPELRRVKSPSGQSQSQSRQQMSDDASTSQVVGKKRTRIQISGSRDDERSDSDRSSPGPSNVKDEPEQDMLEPSPPPMATRVHMDSNNYDNSPAPPPSSVLPSPLKKRRVTVSGAPALDTDVRAPADQSSSTPISPVVIGFTIQRDNPSAVEQVRSMISVKQQQQAIIEQRRGSVAGLVSPVVGSNTPELPQTGPSKQSGSSRVRRSPNPSSRRHTNASQPIVSGTIRPVSPPTVTVTHAQPPLGTVQIPPPNAHSLPPPPISFARRRANQFGGKKKPADIVISPREAHTKEQLALSIQSAPPIPQGGQPAGRFPMTIPRLPPVMAPGNPNINRPTGGRVPPTPTRFSAQRHTNASHTIPSIASTTHSSNHSLSIPPLVPPTPHVLQHPGYTGEKSAFLAPFEMFYDALNDSKQLKTWLSDQLTRSNAMLQQQEKLGELVDALVEKKVAGMRNEISFLRHKVEELEDALHATSRRPSIAEGYNPGRTVKGKQPLRNGIPMEGYTFPAPPGDRDRLQRPEPERRISSPGWTSDRERDSHPPVADTDGPRGSPVPYESRRLSVSASRLDPPRSGADERERTYGSPQLSMRDNPSSSSSNMPTLPPHPSPSGNRQTRGRRPSLTRQHSGSFRGGHPERPASSPPRRGERERQRDAGGDVSMES